MMSGSAPESVLRTCTATCTQILAHYSAVAVNKQWQFVQQLPTGSSSFPFSSYITKYTRNYCASQEVIKWCHGSKQFPYRDLYA